MRRFLWLVVFITISLVQINYAQRKAIVPLTTAQEVADFIQNNEHVAILFVSPWCSDCRQAKKQVNLAVKHYRPVKFGYADTQQVTDACDTYGITHVPTVLLFKNHQKEKLLAGTNELEHLEYELATLVNDVRSKIALENQQKHARGRRLRCFSTPLSTIFARTEKTLDSFFKPHQIKTIDGSTL